jgi:uncharacterized membrane protein YcaP (DUF421 family)
MMMRLAASPNVPIWQLLISVLLLMITSYLTIYAISKFFRAQTLLSGQKFNLRRVVLSLVVKV